MQISPRKINVNIEKQVFAIFHQVLADTNNPEEIKILLDTFLSKAEHRVVAKRLAIAVYLDKGRSYENIKQALKVSSATVARVQESMGEEGMQLALQKVKAEEWADKWSVKIGGLVRAFTGK